MLLSEETIDDVGENFKKEFAEKLSNLSPMQISQISDMNTAIKSAIDLHEYREKFINLIKKPIDIPKPYLYSQELLDSVGEQVDSSKDTSKVLMTFFKSELKRVKDKKERILQRFTSNSHMLDHIPHMSMLNEEFSRYILKCEEGIQRLLNKTTISYNIDDIMFELTSNISKRQKELFLHNVIQEVKLFPCTHRKEILTTLFDSICTLLDKDRKDQPIKLFLTKEDDLNRELEYLTKRFNIRVDIEAFDGQLYQYHTDIICDKICKRIKTSFLPRKNLDIPKSTNNIDLSKLTYDSLLNKVKVDIRFRNSFKAMIETKIDQVLANVKEQSNFYNVFVSRSLHIQRLSLPNFKIRSWLLLRWIHNKYMYEIFVTQINYLEYIKVKLHNPETKIKVRTQSDASEIYEVYDETGPFIFNTTDEIVKKIVKQFSKVASHYLTSFKCVDLNMIDRDNIIENILTLENHLLVAKISLIYSMLEIDSHTSSPEIKRIINNIIDLRPEFDLNIYQSYVVPYQILIDQLNMQAKTIQLMINTQIIHERQVSCKMSSFIPLFDRPYHLDGLISSPKFHYSVPTSIFEVYESLSLVLELYGIIPKITEELMNHVNMNEIKFHRYISYSVWFVFHSFIRNMVKKGLFLSEGSPLPSTFSLSESVSSLLTSQYINNPESLLRLIYSISDHKRLRFTVAIRKLMNFSWIIQNEIYKTNSLLQAYTTQCTDVGIIDSSISLPPIMNGLNDDSIEVVIEFALNEVKSTQIDFSDSKSLNEMLLKGDFTTIEDIIRLQKLENIILETAVRYNWIALDTVLVCDHFNLCEISNSLFLTGEQNPNNIINNDEDFIFKRHISQMLFTEPNTFLRHLSIIRDNKYSFQLNIKHLKSIARSTILSSIKQSPSRNIIEVFENGMIEHLSPYLYKLEIIHICNCERRIVKSSSLSDVFTLGPCKGMQLLNEIGRFEQIFHIPDMPEIIFMLKDLPVVRQTTIFKSIVPYLSSRFRILSLTRFLSLNEQKSDTIQEKLYKNQVPIDNTIISRLSDEFLLMSNMRELDITKEYILEKDYYLLRVLELAILSAIENSYTTTNSSKKDEKHDIQNQQEFRECLCYLEKKIHEPLNTLGLCMSRYLPDWHILFGYGIPDNYKSVILQQLVATEGFVESSVTHAKKQEDEDLVQIQLAYTEFIVLVISSIHLKFCYYLLLDHYEYRKLTPSKLFTDMTQRVFISGHQLFTDGISGQALASITERGEQVPRTVSDAQQIKFLHSVIQILSDNIDDLIVLKQMNELQIETSNIMSKISTTEDKTMYELRPEVYAKQDSPNTGMFAIHPSAADSQFKEETMYAKTSFLICVSKALESSLKDSDKTNLEYNNETLERICLKLSEALNTFFSSSIHGQVLTWKGYNFNLCNQLDTLYHDKKLFENVWDFILYRLKCQANYEIAIQYRDKIEKVNMLRENIKSLKDELSFIGASTEKQERTELDKLIHDLNEEISKRKTHFSHVRESLYDTILKCIQNQSKSDSLNFSRFIFENKPLELENQRIMDESIFNNNELRNKIIRLRVIRVFSDIAVRGLFRKKIGSLESDRKINNSILYSNKLAYQKHVESMEEQIEQGQRRLNEAEDEIECVKQQLGNEKSNNIKLVQWKATNIKEFEELQNEIARISQCIQSDVGDLLVRLEKSREKLDQLEDGSEDFNNQYLEEVVKPTNKARKIRTAMIKSKISRIKIMEGTKYVCAKLISDNNISEKYFITQEENIQIKNRNEQLREQLIKLEMQIKKIPNSTLDLAKTTTINLTKPRSQVVPIKSSSSIVKPVLAKPKMIAKSTSKLSFSSSTRTIDVYL